MPNKITKEKFLFDKLMPYFMQDEENFKNDDLAELEIYPYISSAGDTNYSALRDGEIRWYYIKDEKYKNKRSSANYRIFKKDCLNEVVFKSLLNRYGKDGDDLIEPYSEEVVIKGLIKYMSKEITYSAEWWDAAEKVYVYWAVEGGNKQYKDATKNIASNETYFEDYVGDNPEDIYHICREYLCKNEIYSDIKLNPQYIRLSNKYKNIDEYLKCLGVACLDENSCKELAEIVLRQFNNQNIREQEDVKIIFDVLKYVLEENARTILEKIIFTLTCSRELIFKYCGVINKYQDTKIDGIQFYTNKYGLLDTESYKERVKIALLNNGDGESWDEIKDEKFWKNIYCMSDDYSLLGEAKYVEVNDYRYIAYRNICYENRNYNKLNIILSDKERALECIAEYIKDKYSIEIVDLYDKWDEIYKTLRCNIKKWINYKENEGNYSIDDTICMNLADVEDFITERRIWTELRDEKNKILQRRTVSYEDKNSAKFLNSKYSGICQICKKHTISGESRAYSWRYHITKPHESKLSHFYSNMFCLCPNCHGELQHGFLARDFTEIGKKAREYYDEFIKLEEDEILAGESLISELSSHEDTDYPFKNPIICDVVVNGENRKIYFSWEHFIRLSFLLCDEDD